MSKYICNCVQYVTVCCCHVFVGLTHRTDTSSHHQIITATATALASKANNTHFVIKLSLVEFFVALFVDCYTSRDIQETPSSRITTPCPASLPLLTYTRHTSPPHPNSSPPSPAPSALPIKSSLLVPISSLQYDLCLLWTWRPLRRRQWLLWGGVLP